MRKAEIRQRTEGFECGRRNGKEKGRGRMIEGERLGRCVKDRRWEGEKVGRCVKDRRFEERMMRGCVKDRS
jgi:hypothetical protein